MFKVALKRLRQGTISLQLQTLKNVPFISAVGRAKWTIKHNRFGKIVFFPLICLFHLKGNTEKCCVFSFTLPRKKIKENKCPMQVT